MALGWGGGHFLRHTRFDGLVLHFYGIFAFGMLMAGWTFGSKVPGWIQRHIRLIALAGAFCLLLVAIISACLSEYDRTRYIKWTDIPVATGAAFLILAAAGGGAAWFRAFFSTRVLTWVGGFSYTLYLLHAPLLQLGYLALRTLTTDRNVLFLLLTFIVIPLIVAASFALSLVIERPFLRMIKNRNAMANPRAT
jgi:peptidoglycan/LPS O-acetylase OafA/YrhL